MAFAKGKSGNVRGRPAGSGKLQKIRIGLEKDLPGILATLTTQALAGDPQAAKLILDRCLPALRPETRQSAPAPTDPDGILRAVETGLIGIDSAVALMNLAALRIKIAEGEELLSRVDALEALLLKK